MTETPSPSSALAAAAHAQLRDNAEAIADALGIVEAQLALLKKLDPAARGLALREASRAYESDVSEDERLKLSALQSEANVAFAELRRTLVGLRDTLLLLAQKSTAIGAAAEVLEWRARGSVI